MNQSSSDKYRERLRNLGLSEDGAADRKEKNPPPPAREEIANPRPVAAAAKIEAVAADPAETLPVEAVVADMARRLEECFQNYGDRRFRDAAQVLAKRPPKRSEEDEELDLAIMRTLTQGENALGDMEAARKVALHYPEEDRELMEKRIYDQWQRCGRH